MTTLVSIGNTNTSCAVLRASGRLGPVRRSPTSALSASALPKDGGPVHMIAVVRDDAHQLAIALRRAGRSVVWWGVDRPIPVPHDYRKPAAPGADRLCAALGAFLLLRGPCVVVDAGTAATVDRVGRNGAFLGGAIGPGFGTMAAGLTARAPALPAARPNARPLYPARATQTAVDAGVHAAFEGMLRQLVGAACARSRAPVLVTGGEAALAAVALAAWKPRIVPALVLEGLAALAMTPA